MRGAWAFSFLIFFLNVCAVVNCRQSYSSFSSRVIAQNVRIARSLAFSCVVLK